MSPIAFRDIARLFVNVARLHRTRADQYMDRVGLYSGQALLLAVLTRRDGMTHSEIAEELEISPAAVTKAIKRMERAGYLLRQPDSSDERISRVFLRDKGRKVYDQIEHAFGCLDRMMFAGFTEPELAQLHGLLTRMWTNLQDAQPCEEEPQLHTHGSGH